MSKDRYAISSLNPHTHAGCDNRYKCNYTRRRVSIHTPTQGVTRIHTHIHYIVLGFNPHTHAGCDFYVVGNGYKPVCFNPHTHAGCDCVYTSRLYYNKVSIHTPTQGVTYNKELQSDNEKIVSIHTPTQGVTEKNLFLFTNIEFQSTHPRRVWHTEYNLKLIYYGFNPHTHAGCDICATITGNQCIPLFQSTHPRRVWLLGFDCLEQYYTVSIHTPTQGVTRKRQ